MNGTTDVDNATDDSTVDSGPIAPLALRAPAAARVLGISERALWTATNQGDIPHVKIGRTTIYPIESLREWLAAKARKGTRQ